MATGTFGVSDRSKPLEQLVLSLSRPRSPWRGSGLPATRHRRGPVTMGLGSSGCARASRIPRSDARRRASVSSLRVPDVGGHGYAERHAQSRHHAQTASHIYPKQWAPQMKIVQKNRRGSGLTLHLPIPTHVYETCSSWRKSFLSMPDLVAAWSADSVYDGETSCADLQSISKRDVRGHTT